MTFTDGSCSNTVAARSRPDCPGKGDVGHQDVHRRAGLQALQRLLGGGHAHHVVAQGLHRRMAGFAHIRRVFHQQHMHRFRSSWGSG